MTKYLRFIYWNSQTKQIERSSEYKLNEDCIDDAAIVGDDKERYGYYTSLDKPFGNWKHKPFEQFDSEFRMALYLLDIE